MDGETSVLILSVLDLSFEPNQRIMKIGEIVGAQKLGPTTLVYKKTERNRRIDIALRSMFTISWRDYTRNGIQLNEMNPLWNIPLGINARFVTFLVEWFDALTFILSGFRATKKHGQAFDICIAQGPVEAFAGLILKKFKMIKMLVYDDFDYIPGWYERKFRNIIMMYGEYFTMKRAEVVISSGSLLSMLRRIQVGKPVYHVPNGIDSHLFGKHAPQKEPHSRTKLKLVYAGNISFRYSGLDMVLDALDHSLKKGADDFSITIAGHGDTRDVKQLKRRISLLKERNIDAVYTGGIPHDAIPGILNEADIGLALFPPNRLRMFAFPYKVIEYMAAGLMVIGTERTETARILKKHKSGIAIKYDCIALSELLQHLSAQPERIKAMQQAGIEGSSLYDWHELMEDEHRIIIEAWSEFNQCS